MTPKMNLCLKTISSIITKIGISYFYLLFFMIYPFYYVCKFLTLNVYLGDQYEENQEEGKEEEEGKKDDGTISECLSGKYLHH